LTYSANEQAETGALPEGGLVFSVNGYRDGLKSRSQTCYPVMAAGNSRITV
jgi:hypothetical protein